MSERAAGAKRLSGKVAHQNQTCTFEPQAEAPFGQAASQRIPVARGRKHLAEVAGPLVTTFLWAAPSSPTLACRGWEGVTYR